MIRRLLASIVLILSVAGFANATDYYVTNSGTGSTSAYGAACSGCSGYACTGNTGEITCPREYSSSNDIDAVAIGSGDRVLIERGYEYPGDRGTNLSFYNTAGTDGSEWTAGNYSEWDAWGTGADPILHCGTEATGWSLNGSYYEASIPDTSYLTSKGTVWVNDEPLRYNAGDPDAAGEWYLDTSGGSGNYLLKIRKYDDSSPSGDTIIYSNCNDVIYSTKAYRKFSNLHLKYSAATTGGAFYAAGDNQWFDSGEIGPAVTGVSTVKAGTKITDSYIHDCWTGAQYGDTVATSYGFYASSAAADGIIFTGNFLEENYIDFYITGVTIDGIVAAFNVFKNTKVNGFDIVSGGDGISGSEWVVVNNSFITSKDSTGFSPIGHTIKLGANDYTKLVNNAVFMTTTIEQIDTNQIQCIQVPTSYSDTTSLLDYNSYYVYDRNPEDDGDVDYHYAKIDGGSEYDTISNWRSILQTNSLDGIVADKAEENSIFITEGSLGYSDLNSVSFGNYGNLGSITDLSGIGYLSILDGIPNLTSIDGVQITDGSGTLQVSEIPIGAYFNINSAGAAALMMGF